MLPKGILKIVKRALEGTDSGLPLATPEDLARVSYGLAYIVLPEMVHRSFNDFLRHWQDGLTFGVFLCDYGCAREKVRTTMEQKLAFKMQVGEMQPNSTCYIIEFPQPPPFIKPSHEELMAAIAAGRKPPCLAPYFAAALYNRDSGQRRYYVLGQSPSGGTTFRTVTADGANCNLGPGPQPEWAKFFLHIAENGEL